MKPTAIDILVEQAKFFMELNAALEGKMVDAKYKHHPLIKKAEALYDKATESREP